MNRKFGKLVDGRLEYAPNMVAHDGRSYINPKESDYLKADNGPWYPVESLPPPSIPPAEGYHYASNGWAFDDGKWVKKWRIVENPPHPIYISKAKVAEAVDSMGKTAEFFAWVGSCATYATGWYNGGDSIVYDPTDNASDLASLIAALGVAEADVPALIEKVTA